MLSPDARGLVVFVSFTNGFKVDSADGDFSFKIRPGRHGTALHTPHRCVKHTRGRRLCRGAPSDHRRAGSRAVRHRLDARLIHRHRRHLRHAALAARLAQGVSRKLRLTLSTHATAMTAPRSPLQPRHRDTPGLIPWRLRWDFPAGPSQRKTYCVNHAPAVTITSTPQ
jgi:hypothetical protein